MTKIGCPQIGDQSLLDPGQKHRPLHRARKKPRSAGTFQTDGGDQSRHLIVAVRHTTDQSLPHPRSSPQAGQLGVSTACIDEDQPGGTSGGEFLLPAGPPDTHVGPVLLLGEERFFYN